jgi:hypothetical protein
MNAELVFFGMRLNMAQRNRRRTLVIAIYAALAALMATLWFFNHWRGTGVYVFWAAMLVCRLFLGGYYSGGLVKPFSGKAPKRSSKPPPLLLLKLRVYQPVLAADEPAYRNDERELHQRDHAHYLAYQALGVAVIVPWLLASLRIIHPASFTWSAMSADEMYYGFLMAALTLFLTLPQAILLWTEPDMEREG